MTFKSYKLIGRPYKGHEFTSGQKRERAHIEELLDRSMDRMCKVFSELRDHPHMHPSERARVWTCWLNLLDQRAALEARLDLLRWGDHRAWQSTEELRDLAREKIRDEIAAGSCGRIESWRSTA